MQESILQVKVRLLGVSRPPVWRRILVGQHIRLDRLHEVIQVSMAWEGSHLHVFSAGSAEYGPADGELGFRDERKARLGDLLAGIGDRIRYTYDFGDDWEHEIVLEKMLLPESGELHPTCVAGKGLCPPEDCGGPWGYQDLKAVLADPRHEEHQHMLEWLGLESASEFDPTRFEAEPRTRAIESGRVG